MTSVLYALSKPCHKDWIQTFLFLQFFGVVCYLLRLSGLLLLAPESQLCQPVGVWDKASILYLLMLLAALLAKKNKSSVVSAPKYTIKDYKVVNFSQLVLFQKDPQKSNVSLCCNVKGCSRADGFWLGASSDYNNISATHLLKLN